MVIDELLTSWRSLQPFAMNRPAEAIVLWQGKTGVIYVDNAWGPAIPYPSTRHEDETENYGYRRLKGNLKDIEQIPELQGYPELSAFIAAANSDSSIIESVGCEKGFFAVENQEPITTQLGSYTDLIFSDPTCNESPENLLCLAAYFLTAAEGCERWWSSIELGIQQLRHLDGAVKPWGLMTRVSGFGRDKSEARKHWGVTLEKLTEAACELSDFRALLPHE